MKKVIIIRWCEIHLKGKNRGYFEKLLTANIAHAICGINCKLEKIPGRYLITDIDDFDVDEVISKLKKVSGIHSVSVAYEVKTDISEIEKAAFLLLEGKTGTFKVETNRADKKFYLNSMECSRELGGRILKKYPHLTVNVHEPDIVIKTDIRETGFTFVYSNEIKMIGGMPTGSAGKGLVLISGGIDSPVAAYMMAKRGMKLELLHFHSYPYTSEAAKDKVIELSKLVSAYSCGVTLNIVSFTEIQEEIHAKLPEEYMITMMRRFMMRIAERLAKRVGAQAIITGECLGQVASQTVESITSSNSVIESLPVFRPLIAFDKNEIINLAVQIGTYETSVLPYEDCCTVFLPKYPLIKPDIKKVIAEEKKLDVEGLIERAIKSVEIIKI